MATTGGPKATTQGTLATTPFAHLLLLVRSKGLSGTLAIWSDAQEGETRAGQDRVLFDAGLPVAMRGLAPVTQLAEGLHALFARRKAPYAFYEGQNLLGAAGASVRGGVDLWHVLWRGVREHAVETSVQEILQKIGNRSIQVKADFACERLGLTPAEHGLLQTLQQGPASVASGLCNAELPEEAGGRLIYVLALLRALEVGASPAPASPAPPDAPAEAGARSTAAVSGPPVRSAATNHLPARTSSSPSMATPAHEEERPALPKAPAALNADERKAWEEVCTLYHQLDHLNHFQILGVKTDASHSEITEAYFALVKKWHPERRPAALSPLAEPVGTVFDQMTEAHSILTDQEQRMEYIKVVKDGGGTRAADKHMVAVIQAAMDFQKAEVLLRRRNYAEAKSWVDRAIALDPEQLGHYALRGWLANLLQGGTDVPFAAILADLDRTLEANDADAKAHYYKGVVLKRQGETAQALVHFRRTVALDPRHIEAQRELRLSELRGQSIKPTKKTGLLGKLFSKD